MLEVGLEAEITLQVAEEDTARALGSGDVDVLGTPRVIALCEQAAVSAVGGHLDEGQTSVGTNISVEHLAPTPVGGTVTAIARLEALNGRTLRFSVEARDGAGLIARGSHVRVIVDRRRFTEQASSRS